MDSVHIDWPQGGPFLYQLFRARHLVARELDRCFRGVEPPEGCHVLIYNETDAGLGDVAFATKLSRLLRGHLPSVDVTLVSTDEGKQQTFGLPDGVRLVGETAFLSGATAADRRPTLVLSAPGIFDHCRQRELAFERLGISGDVPFQYIAEYGSLRQLKDDAFKAMMGPLEALGDRFIDEVAAEHGLSPDEMGHSAKTGAVVGVFAGEEGDEVRPLDHLLRAYTRPAQENPMARWLHRPLLGARSCGLELGELGIFIDQPVELMTPRPAALGEIADSDVRELLLTGLAPDAYAAETSLYVGYAYEGLAIFVDYVSILEAGQGRSIDVVVPHRGRVSELAETVFDEDALKRLGERGVGQVAIVGSEDRTEIVLGQGKTLRLITHYPIPHADFRRLHEAAAPATMVSGDQSFSEAISAGKAVLYLEPVYCQTYHLDAVLELAARVAPAAHQVLDFGMQYRWDPVRYPAVQAHLASGELYAGYRALNATIQHGHDCGPPLVELLTRVLWTIARPAVVDAARIALESAWATADPTQGITLRGEDLAALRGAAI